MKVTNAVGQESASSSDGEGVAVLSNGNGGFSFLPPAASSRYDGVFISRRLGQVFRFLESIEQKDPVVEVVNRLWGIERKRVSGVETLVMPRGFNGLILRCDCLASWRLVMDCKAAYDNREWGRHYSLESLPHGVMVSFSKRNDGRDSQHPFGEYDQFMAVHAPGGLFKKIEAWTRRSYFRDKHRNSPPFERFVFVPCEVTARDVVVGFGFSKSQAVSQAVRIWNNRRGLVEAEKARVSPWVHALAQVPEQIDVAFASSANALDCLMVDHQNLYAGLPWFFQFWARDSAISSRALTIIGRDHVAKSIVMEHLTRFLNSSALETRKGGFNEPWAVPQSLDGLLWTFVRVSEMMDASPDFFTGEEKGLIAGALSRALELLQSVMKDGLVHNGPKETWMDTEWGGDDRAGARIEMQALALRTMHLGTGFGIKTGSDRFEAVVKKRFWNNRYLLDGVRADGTPDLAPRPNVFIAAYVYPQLLSTREWKSCMEHLLPHLWLDWGGISSIAKEHPLFTPECTGEQVKSYHRGDSWFWLNSMAAIVLHRLDSARFRPYIEKILEASTRELLFGGAVGHHAEISSAARLSSEGCLSQAWSNALYIELVTELFGKTA